MCGIESQKQGFDSWWTWSRKSWMVAYAKISRVQFMENICTKTLYFVRFNQRFKYFKFVYFSLDTDNLPKGDIKSEIHFPGEEKPRLCSIFSMLVTCRIFQKYSFSYVFWHVFEPFWLFLIFSFAYFAPGNICACKRKFDWCDRGESRKDYVGIAVESVKVCNCVTDVSDHTNIMFCFWRHFMDGCCHLLFFVGSLKILQFIFEIVTSFGHGERIRIRCSDIQFICSCCWTYIYIYKFAFCSISSFYTYLTFTHHVMYFGS